MMKLSFEQISFSPFYRGSVRSTRNVFNSAREIVYLPETNWSAIYDSKVPVVVRGLASQWPAISNPSKCWINTSQLKKRIVPDTVVSIEVGESYMDEQVQKPLVDLESLLDFLMLKGHINNTTPKVYWAQQDLNDVLVMRDDVVVPEICSKTGKGVLYRTNIWFGGSQGTYSPCHYDPFENMLCQVFGNKEVILFPPKVGARYLYPAIGTNQKNTSLVNIDKPNFELHPLYGELLRHIQNSKSDNQSGGLQVEGGSHANTSATQGEEMNVVRAIIHPGDGIYIPYKWWHYCKTSDISCSVNFWWQ